MKQPKIKVEFPGLKEAIEELGKRSSMKKKNEFKPNYISFMIEGKAYRSFNSWNNEHKKKCKLRDKECAISGRLTFEFTPSGIGTFINVKCACGEEIDLTKDTNW